MHFSKFWNLSIEDKLVLHVFSQILEIIGVLTHFHMKEQVQGERPSFCFWRMDQNERNLKAQVA